MDIGQYLQQNYPHVKSVEPVTVNGQVKGYYAKGEYAWDQIYIPVSALNSSNVGMVSYLPGAGGSGNDAAKLRERIQNNPPDYIISIAAECSDHHNALGTGYSMAKGLGINVTNNVTVCFSASGYRGIERTEEFTRAHPEVKNTIVSCEPFGGEKVYSKDISGLQQNGSKIIFVTPQKFHVSSADQVSTLSAKGVDTYWLQTNYKGKSGSVHIATNRDVITSGFLDYLLGYSTDFNKEPGGNSYTPGWKLIGYDKATGQRIEVDYSQLLQSGVAMIQLPDLNALKKVDAHTITTKASPVQKKYASLKNLTNTEIKSKDGTPVSSEYAYVSETMNNLKNQIKSASFLSGFNNLGFRSSSGIPGCIMGYLNTYFDIVGSLMNSLSLEADAVISYGQAMVDMDYDLAHGASQVGTITETDNSARMIKPGGLEAFEEKPPEEKITENQNGTNTNSNGTNTNSNGYNNSNYDGNSYYPSESSVSSSSSSSPSNPSSQGEQIVETRKTEAPLTETTPIEEKKTEEQTSETEQPTKVVQYIIQEPENEQATMETTSQQTQLESPPQQVQTVEQYNPNPGGYYNEPTETSTPPAETGTAIDSSDIPNVTIDGTEDSIGEDKLNIQIPTELPTEQSTSNYTKIPMNDTPVEPPKKKGNAILPVVAGLSVAAAAGIGAKAYIDHKTNKNNGENDEEYYDDTEEAMDFSYNDNEMPEEAYSAKTQEDLLDAQL